MDVVMQPMHAPSETKHSIQLWSSIFTLKATSPRTEPSVSLAEFASFAAQDNVWNDRVKEGANWSGTSTRQFTLIEF
jgi:hypothetical protein